MAINDIFKGVGSILTGGLSGLGGKIVDVVANQFPEKMSELEKKQIEIEIMKIVDETKLNTLSKWNEQEKQFHDFIKDMEGTSSDLKQIPIFGRVVLFLRGSFRPLMAFGVGYTDLMILMGEVNLTSLAGSNSTQAWSLLWVLNILVLGFYFGERAMKNVLPLIERLIEKSVFGK